MFAGSLRLTLRMQEDARKCRVAQIGTFCQSPVIETRQQHKNIGKELDLTGDIFGQL